MTTLPFASIYPVDAAAAAASSDGGSVVSISGNDQFPGMPAGATPVHKDMTVDAAGTVTVWDPGAGTVFVLASAFISTDAAMRVALVDESDAQGSRPVDGYFGANGGTSPNLVPVPYQSKTAGNRLKLVTSAAGNVKVAVRGWTRAG